MLARPFFLFSFMLLLLAHVLFESACLLLEVFRGELDLRIHKGAEGADGFFFKLERYCEHLQH